LFIFIYNVVYQYLVNISTSWFSPLFSTLNFNTRFLYNYNTNSNPRNTNYSSYWGYSIIQKNQSFLRYKDLRHIIFYSYRQNKQPNSYLQALTRSFQINRTRKRNNYSKHTWYKYKKVCAPASWYRKYSELYPRITRREIC
jgi:hypothetical protein